MTYKKYSINILTHIAMKFFKFTESKKSQALFSVVMVIVILFSINILANLFNNHLDLTEEKRFTLTRATVNQLKELDDVIFVRILLEGDFPADFKRLQSATVQLLSDFKGINPNVSFKFENPTEGGSAQEKTNKMKEMAERGLVPVRFMVQDNDKKSEQYIFPFAVCNYRGREVIVKLLENEIPGQPSDIALNNSISLLEYKFSNAFQKLRSNRRPNIFFCEGHQELATEETADIEQNLASYYNTGRINLDSVYEIPYKDPSRRIDVLVVAKPKTAFSEKHKFLLDQYIMQGGKVIWLIDRLNADLAAMQQTGDMLPTDLPLNLEDMFFKYGFRIMPNLILDTECARIPLKVGQIGGAPQLNLFKWYYSPLVAPKSQHPVVKSIDRVWLQFPSSIDTIKTRTNLQKTILLTSSRTSRLQFVPSRINFEILRYQEDLSKFDKGNQTVAVMLEGTFPSLFENRVTAEQNAVMAQLGLSYKSESAKTKMLVVSDGDVARNEYDFAQKAMLPLGFNRFEKYKFANKEFLLNAVEYMLDDNGIIEARGKDIKLRLFDKEKVKNDKNFWRTINILVPLIFLAAFGFGFTYMRRKKYAQPQVQK